MTRMVLLEKSLGKKDTERERELLERELMHVDY